MRMRHLVQWGYPNIVGLLVPDAGIVPVNLLGTKLNPQYYCSTTVLCPIMPVSGILSVLLAGKHRRYGRPPVVHDSITVV